ncbi:response regulator [Anabaenopsis tanganyikae CS-531]|uniref:Response regulator n=2 Tax=Anabaenopsis TaxID=110103 RepID=A0ABT5AYC7_9CYAN|nr:MULTISPECIES: response regulator [Anabaenopsis]MDB9541295.1 response regulator [Anabaenopsis arnoldii]MDH6093735.1 response regulator [Anabaenopsis arnoldii]MDH6105698.1 response regulator [Anabaenopsis tanganyikae CS-531]
MKILLIDDDTYFSKLLTNILISYRYVVDVATNGHIGLEMVNQFNYDLILLDVLMPKLDGLSVCRQLRQHGCQVPILMLTAKGAEEDVIRGLDAGADDYVVKSCDTPQLLARIRALSRRVHESSLVTLEWGNLSLNPQLLKVQYGEELIQLTPKEFGLLELFLRSPHRILTRRDIIDKLWLADEFPTDNAVTNLIKDLRRKLKAAGIKEEVIETIYGLGYRLKARKEGKSESPVATVDDIAEGIALIEEIKAEFQASLPEKIAELNTAINQLQLKTNNSQQQQHILTIVHRLAGNLGTFGYPEGSEIAREIEALLTQEHLSNAHITELSFLLEALSQGFSPPGTTLPLNDSNIREHIPTLIPPDDFSHTLKQEWQRLRTQYIPLGLIFCAIDDFEKQQQKIYLLQLGQTLQKYLTPPSFITYYTGGKFGILLPSMPSDSSLRLAQHLYQAILSLEKFTISLGITGTIPSSTATPEELLTTVDQALTSAQTRGGNTLCFYLSG